jgi:hypothetical protein
MAPTGRDPWERRRASVQPITCRIGVSSLNAYSARRPGGQRLAGGPAKDRQEGARLADIVDQHIRWRLWHGQVQRSLNLIGDALEPLDVMAKGEASTAVPAAKVAGVLRGLETYVSGQSDLIIDYATERRGDEPISTATTTESTVQWLLHRRMGATNKCAGRREVRI